MRCQPNSVTKQAVCQLDAPNSHASKEKRIYPKQLEPWKPFLTGDGGSWWLERFHHPTTQTVMDGPKCLALFWDVPKWHQSIAIIGTIACKCHPFDIHLLEREWPERWAAPPHTLDVLPCHGGDWSETHAPSVFQRAKNGALGATLSDLRSWGAPDFAPNRSETPSKQGFGGLWTENRGAPRTQIQRRRIQRPSLGPLNIVPLEFLALGLGISFSSETWLQCIIPNKVQACQQQRKRCKDLRLWAFQFCIAEGLG